jgi:hypothetical protein
VIVVTKIELAHAKRFDPGILFALSGVSTGVVERTPNLSLKEFPNVYASASCAFKDISSISYWSP